MFFYVRRVIPMLNRVSGNKQCDKSFQGGGHRMLFNLVFRRGASQTQPASGMQSIV